MPVVGEELVRETYRSGRRKVVVGTDDIVTAQALDAIERLGMRLLREPPPRLAPLATDPGRAVTRTLYRRNPRFVASEPRAGLRATRFNRVVVVGAGGVGSTVAHLCAAAAMTEELVIVDIVPGLAAGVALDIEQACGITRVATRARGGESRALVAGADVVVVAAGRPRSPGMDEAATAALSRGVVQSVGEAVAEHAPDALVVLVTEPVEEMAAWLCMTGGLQPERVLGVGATLGTARLVDALARAAGVPCGHVDALALGGDGARLVPIFSAARVRGRPARDALKPPVLDEVAAAAAEAATHVNQLKTVGSATVAPAHAVVEILQAVRGARAGAVPMTTWVDGEYGVEPGFLGVPAIVDRFGVREVVELGLDARELEALRATAAGVQSRVAALSLED
jgi:malate dehydrogenase